MNINIQILNANDSWKHQLDVYRGYHEKYASIYPLESFFYHPYLLEKFSHPNLSERELKIVETYFKTQIYDQEKLEQAKNTISEKAVPFLLSKNAHLEKLAIKHPDNLTIKLSGAMSGGFYNVNDSSITISPQCVTENFIPLLLVHEFTHICIEEHIQKNNISHQAKERIVSRICSEILEFDDHNMVGDKNLDRFLTKDKLSSDFSGVISSIKNYYKANQAIMKNNQNQGK